MFAVATEDLPPRTRFDKRTMGPDRRTGAVGAFCFRQSSMASICTNSKIVPAPGKFR